MKELDQIFELLSEERRRYVLYFLEQQDGPVPVEAVAEQIAEWETDGSPESIPEEKFERIEIKLIHNDLPKASEARYIEYDPEEAIVELTDASPTFKAVISVAETVEQPDQDE